MAEKNYKIYNKKMLVIMYLEEWQVYLEGVQPSTEIYTNHPNLMYFMITKTLNSKQARWSEKLRKYNFKIMSRSEHPNSIADFSQKEDYIAKSHKKYKKLWPLLLSVKKWVSLPGGNRSEAAPRMAALKRGLKA